jgi:hypothetical protein
VTTLGLTATLRQLPAEVAHDVAVEFARTAERHGGQIKGYPLTATPGAVTITDATATVQMRGVPAGFWSWREYGTKPHSVSPRNKRAMGGGLEALLGHPYSGVAEGVYMPARHRWTAALDDFEGGYGALVGAVVDRTWK